MTLFKKILSTLNVSTIAILPCFFFTTSCNKEKEIDKSKAEKYISDRTFSVMSNNPETNTEVLGTCWIISDATKSDYTDYTYYVGSNWHVFNTEYRSKSSIFYFSDRSISSKLYSSDYTQFTSFELEPESNFYYDISKNEGIDFYVAKADFSSAPQSIKTKLNELNTLQKEKGYITQFTDTCSTSKNYIVSGMATAGYPVKDKATDPHAVWECQTFIPNNVSMKFRSDLSHYTDSKEIFKDVSYQYCFNKNMGKNWMTEGASGSMLIGDYNGEYKVAGIYWGGYTDAATRKEFYPSFSILNSNTKNFLSKYL